MKYHCFYHSNDNTDHDEWIEARDRNDAFAQFKRRGIRLYRVVGRNPLEWRRWTAIGVLAVVAIAALVHVGLISTEIDEMRQERTADIRSQIYGDPTIISQLAQNGWRAAFLDAGDAWLARHAQPGVVCDCAMDPSLTAPTSEVAVSLFKGVERPLEVRADDREELKKAKRIVNGMKAELFAYLKAGGSVNDYMRLCDERLTTERGIRRDVERDLALLKSRITDENRQEIFAQWEKKNALLRSMGLATFSFPEEP